MGDAPDPPDPFQQGAAQQAAELGASQGSSIINNPNQYNPYGSQTYSIAGYETIYDAQGKPQYVPRYNQTTTLSPDQMKLLGLNTQTQYNLGSTAVQQSAFLKDYLGKMVNPAGWQKTNAGPAAPKLATTFGGQGDLRQDQAPTDRRAVEEALMGRQREAMGKQSAAEDAQLAARGLSPGSAQYGDVADTRARAATDAQQQAFLASGQESRQAQDAYNRVQAQRFQEAASRGEFSNAALQNMFAMGGSAADRQNALRAQQAQETFALRNQPINEISALLSGSQVTNPQFNPFSAQGIGAAPVGQYMGQNYANELQASNAQNAGLFGLGGSLMGAIGSAGGLASFFSDRALKTDIEPTGETLAGAPLYRFRFVGDDAEYVGVMADEVRELHPDAVQKIGFYDAVDYGLLATRH